MSREQWAFCAMYYAWVTYAADTGGIHVHDLFPKSWDKILPQVKL